MYASRDPRLVLVRVVDLQALELVEELARALVVLLLVARRRRFVERLGEAVGVARNQVVVVARVVEAELLVRDAPEREAREIAHGEEALVGVDRRARRRALRVRDLAEEVLAFFVVLLLDLDETLEVRRLRPETRALRDLGVRDERAVRVVARLGGASVQVADLAARLFGCGLRHELEVVGGVLEVLRLDADLDEPPHRAPRVGRDLLPRAGLIEELPEVRARGLVRARARVRVAEQEDRRATRFVVRERLELRALDEIEHARDRFVDSPLAQEILALGVARLHVVEAEAQRAAELSRGQRLPVRLHRGPARVGRAARGRGGRRIDRDRGRPARGRGVRGARRAGALRLRARDGGDQGDRDAGGGGATHHFFPTSRASAFARTRRS